MSTTGIKLNFINESNDQNNSNVVIFQKNVAPNFDEIAVAWKVIKNCGAGWQHAFTFPTTYQIGVSDAWGNSVVQPLDANDGQQFQVHFSTSGNNLGYAGQATSNKGIELKNNLTQGSIDAHIYKAGKLLATKNGISPQQSAVFQFTPTIWMGVVAQIEEGEIMNQAIISAVNTELNLLGITSADIIMTGGGAGPSAQPFTFLLDNVK